jgi:hypothetical protein
LRLRHIGCDIPSIATYMHLKSKIGLQKTFLDWTCLERRNCFVSLFLSAQPVELCYFFSKRILIYSSFFKKIK